GQSHGLAQRAKVLFDQAPMEAIVTGGDWSVGRKDHAARNAGNSLAEAEGLFLGAATKGFEHGKAAVAFVVVKHSWPEGHGAKGAEASNTQKHLLADTEALIAAVEPRGELAIFGRVLGDIGIEQQ